jgi:hypothetical protein
VHDYYFAALAAPEQLSIARRLDKHIEIVGEDWIYQGARSHNGYAHIRTANSCARAHRVAYEIVNGPIPEDRPHIDHVWTAGCRSKACVRPSHLEAVSQAENNRRAAAARSLRALETPAEIVMAE